MLFIYEDAGNHKSPRRGFYKYKVANIPEFAEWFMFEAPGAWMKMKTDEVNDKKNNAFLKEKKKAGNETLGSEDKGGEGEEEEVKINMKNRVEKYYKDLKMIVYEDAQEAADVTFKRFMQTHIRYYVPGYYKGLIKD